MISRSTRALKPWLMALGCAVWLVAGAPLHPLRDNTEAYETMDCAKAAHSGVTCSFTN